MAIRILDTQGKETAAQKFTKPLRGVLGGRKISNLTNSPAEAVAGKSIFKIWQRAIVGVLLFTVAIPYTLTAAVVLLLSGSKDKKIGGSNLQPPEREPSAVRSNSQSSEREPSAERLQEGNSYFGEGGSLSLDEQRALLSIFSGTEIDLRRAENAAFYPDIRTLWKDIKDIEKPTFSLLNWGGSVSNLLVVPVYVDRGLTWEKCQVVFEKHPQANGEDAAWNITFCLESGDILRSTLPLFSPANPEELRLYINLMSNRPVEIGGWRLKLHPDNN